MKTLKDVQRRRAFKLQVASEKQQVARFKKQALVQVKRFKNQVSSPSKKLKGTFPVGFVCCTPCCPTLCQNHGQDGHVGQVD